MTVLLQKAFSNIGSLPEHDQDAIASLILDEIASEQKWDALFASSPGQLSAMAAQAIKEFKAGKTTPLDPDRDL